MSSLKRKRLGAPSRYILGPQVPRTKKRKTFRSGRTRTAGYYGRFRQGGELKFHDITYSQVNVSSTGHVKDSINEIGQGVTESTRIGRKCNITSIHWRYSLKLSEGAGAATPRDGDIIRIILFVDKQANGATAAVTDILETANYQSFRNLANSGRFMILKDCQHVVNVLTLGQNTSSTVFANSEVLKEFIYNKKCNIPLEFDNTTGALTELRSNNIGVLLISKNNDINLNSKFRLRFSD